MNKLLFLCAMSVSFSAHGGFITLPEDATLVWGEASLVARVMVKSEEKIEIQVPDIINGATLDGYDVIFHTDKGDYVWNIQGKQEVIRESRSTSLFSFLGALFHRSSLETSKE